MPPPIVTTPQGDPVGSVVPGLLGKNSGSGPGVLGEGKDGPGVQGQSDNGPGVSASSNNSDGLSAETFVATAHAVAAYQRAPIPNLPALGVAFMLAGAALYAECKSGYAGNFVGKVHVDGDVDVIGNISADDVVLTGQDCAEHFGSAETVPIEAGTVMVLGEAGSLQKSSRPYDKRVAGIVSGAGPYKPAVILGRPADKNTNLIALSGKVFCRADAEYGAIEVGDLLTTSDTPGHAMKAADPNRAFGTVLGKAMGDLEKGRGLIPVLVGLL